MSRLAGGALLALLLVAHVGAQDTCGPEYHRGSPLPQIEVATTAGVPIVVDVDRDGHLDVLVASDTLELLYGDGSGAFPTSVLYDVGTRAVGVELGDSDGDGDLDLLVTGLAIELFVNDGQRGFEVVSVAPPFTSEQFFRRSSFADLDGDGDLDVLDSVSGGRVVALWNDGDDGFRTGAELVGRSTDLAVADVDGDARDEVFVVEFDGSVQRIDVEWTDGVETALTKLLVIGPQWLRLHVVDADDDGDPDLTDGWSNVFVNEGGTLVAPTSLTAQGRLPVVGYFDHDDVLDAVTWSPWSLSRRLSTGSHDEILLDLRYGAPIYPTIEGVAVGDLDEDGADELIVSTTLFSVSDGATFAFVGRALPPPALTSAAPTTLREPGEHEIVIEGTDFQPGTWCVAGSEGPLTVLSATRESTTRMVVRVRVDAGSGSETTSVYVRGPDDRGFSLSIRVRSRYLTRARGRLIDADAVAFDVLRLAGRLRANELAGSQRLYPRTRGMTLRVGNPDRPVVLQLPAEHWRVHERRRRHVYRSPAGIEPRVRVEIDERESTFRLRVAHVDLETRDDGALLVEFASGGEELTEVLATRERVRRSTQKRRVLRVR